MKLMKKSILAVSALILSGTMAFSAALPYLGASERTQGSSAESGASKGLVTDVTGTVQADLTQYFDDSVVQKLPESVSANEEISVILSLDEDTVLDVYNGLGSDMTVGQFASSKEGKAVSARIKTKSDALLTRLTNAGVGYQTGDRFDTLLGGVEVVVKASDFSALCNAVKGRAGVMVGEVYRECETKVVENDVNVYESTGIFDSSKSEYDGTGTVIAVLDTGLDYTHSAFDPKGFTADPNKDVITRESLNGVIGELEAAQTTPGLTAANVYLNRKVPYAYDYADKDDDVAPINSDHGTHVAGIMVGKDSVITGVAPNAQLAVMKVFSEKSSGAKTSWLISALEDCVKLQVDVINMSLGTACGFSRETDEDQRYVIYDRIKEQGISLIAAASNDYNATFGSEKNGNLGLTSNPDSGTVGAPSTYDAALSVASISGVKTPYFKLGETIVYFTEASDSAAKPKDFVSEIFAYGVEKGYIPANVDSYDFEYEIVPGVGSLQNFEAEYGGANADKLRGKIALIRRGQTNFEEKASLARDYGAVGCIIYNNVSGDISMNVGKLGNYPVCSLSRDDGEILLDAYGSSNKITIGRNQKAGPFMSDFSSWGPTSDLRIKPEITAHGGDIYSSVPGQSYDRMSGTSMASPNQAGMTALVRQYVKEKFQNYKPTEVTATVNQLMMSTADIAVNTNGLPFSVRKQGAGLGNLEKSTHSPAYLQTFDRDDPSEVMDKTKIELGDDPAKTGIYTLRFNIVNMENFEVSYDVDAQVLTEGVSENLTYKGDTTVTQKGYLLEGAAVEVTERQNCGGSGNSVTVSANQTATVTVTITLTDANKDYLDRSFANGMYVEGFVTLADKRNVETKYDLNAPFLAYYGDWAQAPLFDLDYFATNADELDDSKETLEKTLPDAYATRPVGGLYDDYIVYLGSFPYVQDPNSTSKVAADRDHIAFTNQTGEYGGVNSINSVQLGMLRGAKRMTATVTDATTGEVIFTKEQLNLAKSYNYGGAIYGTSFDVDFNLADYDLKNNTKYIFKLEGFIDYGNNGHVENNSFEFPFYTDFTAPIVTGVEYTYEYDRDTETNRLFANISVYDNHYVRGMFPGYIGYSPAGSSATYTLYGFGRYVQPVLGGRNTTSVVQVELTDYLQLIKNSSYNHKSFMVQLMDCAQNTSTFELTIPDDIATVKFKEEEIKISPNEVYHLDPEISPSQDKAWKESLNYTVSDDSIARVVNGKLIGLRSGEVTLTATSNRNENVKTSVKVTVLKEGDEGYKKLDRPVAENFRLTGYLVEKVYYFLSTDERDLGATEAGSTVQFTSSVYSLKMLPSESVTIQYDLRGYFPDNYYKVEFTSSNPRVVEVDKDKGTITAKNVDEQGNPLNSERSATVNVRLLMLDPATGEYKTTMITRPITVTVKEAYTTNGPYLVGYKGLGGKVVIPEDLGITEIQQFAFSNYDLVPKDLSAGDEITEEDPYYSKQWYIGDNTITEVVIPEGVKVIGMYAFANLTALQSISLPSTLTKIQTGAFIGCSKLAEIKFPQGNHLQFVNQRAFEDCGMLAGLNFSSVIAIGDAAFKNAGLISIQLPTGTQSIGAEAFAGNSRLASVTIEADKVKIGASAFRECAALKTMKLNASILPSQIFEGCAALSVLTIGKDVELIGEYALRGTGIKTLQVDPKNPYFQTGDNSNCIIEKDTGKLALVAPSVNNFENTTVTEIGDGAFSAASNLVSVNLPKVTKIGDYAFSRCARLASVSFDTLESVGDYAFYGTALANLPTLKEGAAIGERAFSQTAIKTITLGANANIGPYAFAQNFELKTVDIGDDAKVAEGAFFANFELATVKIGDNAVIGDGAFSAIDAVSLVGSLVQSGSRVTYNGREVPTNIDPYLSKLSSLTIGANATIGEYAFSGAGSGSYTFSTQSGSLTLGGKLETVELGAGAKIGAYAFRGCHYLKDINLSEAKSVGAYAFGGQQPEYLVFDTGEILVVRVNPYGAVFTEVNLTGLDGDSSSLGAAAFSDNTELKQVTLPQSLTNIPAGAFLGCVSLSEIDLSNVRIFGAQAFEGTALEKATLAEGALLGDGVFSGCSKLATVENLDKAVYVGANAFNGAAVTEADLSSAVYLGNFAFKDSKLTSVVLGEMLATVGENPFSGCAIESFANETGDTFDVSASVKVIGGVIYTTCPNGLTLVSYPMKKEGKSFTVARDVVRIGAEAFRGAELLSVTLSRRVGAIGDRAFYGCDSLAAVVFTGIEAPILEEQYNAAFDADSAEGIPLYLTNNFAYYVNNNREYGLKIVPFQIWNVDSTCVLQGANFVAEIGTESGRAAHAAKTLVMVRPINGNGYENYLYGQYFDVVLDGPTALSDETQSVIDRIDALPATVSLNDRTEVEDIRSHYNALTADQQGCVTNYGKLESAESRIRFLLSEQGEPEPEKPENSAGLWWIYIVVGVLAAAAVGAVVCILLIKKRKDTPAEGGENAPDAAENETSENEVEENEAAENDAAENGQSSDEE